MAQVAKMIAPGVDTLQRTQRRKITHFTSEEYLGNLLNPINQDFDSKIPDMASYPTSTYSQKQEFNFKINGTAPANGFGGCSVELFAAPHYFVENATSNDTTISYGSQINFTGNGQIQQVYARHRLVGAGLEVEFLGNDAQNQGEIYFGFYSNGENRATSLAEIQTCRDGCDGPAKYGGFIRYRPRDERDFNMQATSDKTVVTNPVPYTNLWGIMQVHVSGGQPDTSYRVRVVTHWEGIQKDDSYSFNSVEESPINPLQLAAVSSVAQKFDSTGTFQQRRDQMHIDYLIGRSYLIMMGATQSQASK